MRRRRELRRPVQLRQTNRDLQAQIDALTEKWAASEKARREAETAAAPSQTRATELQQRLTASQLTLAASQDRVGQLNRELRVTKEALAAKSLAYDNQAAGNTSLESENIQRTDEFVQATAALRAQLTEVRAELLSAQAALLTSVPRQKYDAAQREVAQLRSVAQASLRVVLTPRLPVRAVGVQASVEPSSSGRPPASPTPAVDLDAVRRRAASQMVALGVRLHRLSRDVAAVVQRVEEADVDGARAALVALRESFEAIVGALFDAGAVWVDVAALPEDAAEWVLARRRQ
ncbi:hypothetical protein PLICRDRAFT_32975 [Plicaturopsis crispa FD-325 SS-3]|uniref:Uncharacterized protein n=1 Tax=Plicaturopsis crispa FD-325 SS-3 TaxID=944288 RepID=A0A0C9T2C2_PLICR|nr:hypothetical protein PLICRDRAFT_32975 [Plicaturopsis crispa FD-325 SS-3]